MKNWVAEGIASDVNDFTLGYSSFIVHYRRPTGFITYQSYDFGIYTKIFSSNDNKRSQKEASKMKKTNILLHLRMS